MPAEVEGGLEVPAFIDDGRRLLAGWGRRHPRLTEAALALVISLPATPLGPDSDPGSGLATVAAWVLWALAFAPLLWRRSHPGLVFAAVTAVMTVQAVAALAEPAFTALLAALYSLTRYGRLRQVPVAAVIAYAELMIAWTDQDREGPGLGERAFFLAAAVTAAISLGLTIRIRRAHLEALEDRARRLEAERDQRARLAVVTERTRIAREMHDVIGHHLAVVVGLADGGSALSRTVPERGTEALTSISGVGRQALSELRGLLGVLQDHERDLVLAPQPSLAQLPELLAQVTAAGLPVELETRGPLDLLPTGVQIAVYRIVQEALTNTLKHAGPAATAAVSLAATDAEVTVRVDDTGVGGPPAEGHGLDGIRERAALYGGHTACGPSTNGGWSVTATLNRESS